MPVASHRGQASAHGRGPGPAFLGAVVGAVVGGAIVSHSYAREPVYVEGPPPPPPPRVVYYEPAPVYEYRVVEPRPVCTTARRPAPTTTAHHRAGKAHEKTASRRVFHGWDALDHLTPTQDVEDLLDPSSTDSCSVSITRSASSGAS